MGRIKEELRVLNYRDGKENERAERLIVCGMIVASLLYGGFALWFIHRLWYQWLIALFSGLVFGFVVKEWWLGFEKGRHIRDVNELAEAFARCYEGSNGSLRSSVEGAKGRVSERMGRFLDRLTKALESKDYEAACDELIEKFGTGHLCTLIDLAVIMKRNGRVQEKGGTDLFSRALIQLSGTIGNEIIHQEKEVLENKSTELWILLAPIVIFPGTWSLYSLLFQPYFDILSCYKSLEACSVASLIFLSSSLGAVFFHWVRKK